MEPKRMINIRCSECDTIVQLERGWFGWRKRPCPKCSREISFKEERMQVVHCAHCENDVVYDTLLGKANLCPVCGKPLLGNVEEPRFTEVPCPKCGVKMRIGHGEGPCTCQLCGHVFDAKSVLRKEEASVNQDACVIRCGGDEQTLIWKHPLDRFPFKSQLIVNAGMTALFIKNGVCEYPVGPGNYLMENTPMTMEQKLNREFDASGSMVFVTDVFFVQSRIHREFAWGTPNPPEIRDADGENAVIVRASGKLSLGICNARLFAEWAGYRTWTVQELAGEVNSRLCVLVREKISNIFNEELQALVIERKWDVLRLKDYSGELRRFIRGRADEELRAYGLEIKDYGIEGLAIEKTAETVRRELEAEKGEEQRKRLRSRVERNIQWTADPLPVHMKGDSALAAEVVLCGTCTLRIADIEKLEALAETEEWKEETAADQAASAYFSRLIGGLLTGMLNDILQPMIDDCGADVRELNRYFSYLRTSVSNYLNQELFSRGMYAADFTIRQKELSKSAVLAKQTELLSFRAETSIAEEMRRFTQNLEYVQADETAEHRVRIKQIGLEEKRQNAELDAVGARIDAQQEELRTTLELERRERAERLRRFDEEQRRGAERRESAYQSEVEKTSFEETYAQWKRENQLAEEKLRADIRTREIRHGADINLQKMSSSALREDELLDTQQKHLIGEILRKIEESDFDWKQKLDAYERLTRNTQLKDEVENTRFREETEAGTAYTWGRLKHLLTDEENELLEKVKRSEEERQERLHRAEFARDMEEKKFAVAHEMELLQLENEQKEKERAMEERLHSQEAEIERLKLTLAHDEAMGQQQSETEKEKIRSEAEAVRAKAENEYVREQQSSREQRADSYAQRAEDLLRRMWDIQQTIETLRLENEREYNAGRANVDEKWARNMSGDRIEELIAYMEMLAEGLDRSAGPGENAAPGGCGPMGRTVYSYAPSTGGTVYSYVRPDGSYVTPGGSPSGSYVTPGGSPSGSYATPGGSPSGGYAPAEANPGLGGYGAAAGMSYCIRCGAQISDQASFCPKCGNPVRR